MRTLLAAITVLVLWHVAVAGTVQQRLASDPAFKLYVAIFKVTQAADGSVRMCSSLLRLTFVGKTRTPQRTLGR